ncbi:DUF6314 family protein [Nocardioides sp. URHA0020]|uniref:DUF6314 family protein n=1 Tax=Nocardioides sp. URHA0020 TaxID=1380392 RepID=UPI00068723EA|nr:DUF6314 family protein [Nocardioides sp. URHA0020]
MLPTDLLGTWALTRVVDDHRAGERHDVVGTAELTAVSPDRVRWTESGTMTWPGHAVPVSRTLYVVREDDWWVQFEDGRPFHPWTVGRQVDHPCAPDHYRGLIEVDAGPALTWTATWDAIGPEKDYRMVTVHSGRC